MADLNDYLFDSRYWLHFKCGSDKFWSGRGKERERGDSPPPSIRQRVWCVLNDMMTIEGDSREMCAEKGERERRERERGERERERERERENLVTLL